MLAAVLIAALAPGAAPPGDELPHRKLALELLAPLGLEGAPPSEIDVERVLEQSFARVRLGAYLLLFPTSARGGARGHGELELVCRTLLEGQRVWLDWLDPDGADPCHAGALADIGTLERWVRSWRPGPLSAVGAGANLVDALAGGEDVRRASERLFDYMQGGGPLALPQAPAEISDEGGAGEDARSASARLILVPTRAEFVRLCSAIGWILEDLREVLWVPAIADWIEFRFNDTRVVALEFGSGDRRRFDRGVPMDDRNPRGMQEQVGQLALGSLTLAVFGGRIDPDFNQSLCNNLVIEMFGELDTRSDGDLRPRSAPPRQVFVPGGRSSGGALPPNSAESPWREGKGADHFLAVLRRSQKLGAKEIKDRRAVDAFRILADHGAGRFVARAPFFGPGARAEAPPEEFRGEWLELLRAYRVAFVHWLREHGAGAAEVSHRLFGELLALVAAGEEDLGFADAFERTYGKPLSGGTPAGSDLEGAFLTWLARRR